MSKFRFALGTALVAGMALTFVGCDDDSAAAPSETSLSCKTESLPDSSGLVIYCNGDSIGVLYNGKDGVAGKDGAAGAQGEKGDAGADGAEGAPGSAGSDGRDGAPGSAGSNGRDGEDGKDGATCEVVESSPEFIRIKCGEEESVINLVKEGSPLPFVFYIPGTNATAYELMNGRTLKQTGQAFMTFVDSSAGVLNVKKIKLSSQYAYIMFDGYYVDPVTGRLSEGPVILQLLTNLKGRQNAFVSYLTHLEYSRVNNLVTKNGLSVANAKRMAMEEMAAAFHIDASGVKPYLEDFDLTRTDVSAMLAMMILLQGNRSAAEMTSFLAKLGSGSWVTAGIMDSVLVSQMSDWAVEQARSGGLEKIRKQWEARGIGEIPDFETHINRFWSYQCGLGGCYDVNDGAQKYCTDKYSIHYAESFDDAGSSDRFICKNGEWSIASAAELDASKYDAAVYDKCGDEVYDTVKNSCCAGVPYDPAKNFCATGGVVVELCGGLSYKPQTQTCEDGVVTDIPVEPESSSDEIVEDPEA